MARAHEYGMAYADLDRMRIDERARSLVPLDTLVEHGLVPVKLVNRTIYVASFNPGARDGLSLIAELTGLRVVPVLALEEAVKQTLAHWSEANKNP